MKKEFMGYKRTLLFLLSLLLFVQAGLFPLSEPVFAAEAEQTEELLSSAGGTAAGRGGAHRSAA